MGAGHWDAIYASRGEQDVSWFEAFPAVSLRMLEAAGLTSESCVIDVGGGAARLVDALVARGLDCLVVLDMSDAALQRVRARLGPSASVPVWIVSDVAGDWSSKPMDIWHDRAVFHFLTDPADRARYVARLRQTLKPSGSAVIATFALDGPARCSGLPVVRYSPESLAAELGAAFRLEESTAHMHVTPAGVPQSIQCSRFTRVG
jgi:SAM-dependent methyltransferase